MKKIIICIIALMIAGCGVNSTTESNVKTSNLSDLVYFSPNLAPSLLNESVNAYVVVQNNGPTTLSNLNYTIANQIGFTSPVIITNSNHCAIVTGKGGQCTLILRIPPYTTPGSFNILASFNVAQLAISNDKLNTAFVAESNTFSSNAIGIELALPSDESGPNGVALYFSNTIINGTQYVLVMGIVNALNGISFNNIVLSDSGSTPFANQIPLSSNIGPGKPDLTFGSTFAILLPLASVRQNQDIFTQTQEVNNSGTITATALASNPSGQITIISEAVAIISVAPVRNIVLTESTPSQTISISNTGIASASGINAVSSSPNINIIQPSTNLAPGASTYLVLNLINPMGTPESDTVTLTYSNGESSMQTTINVYQLLSHPLAYAIFADYLSQSYTQCTVDNYGIESASCITVKPTGAGAFNFPNGVAVNESYVYFSNYNNKSYTQCSIDSNGVESNSCITIFPSGAGALYLPRGIAFESYAYILSSNGGNTISSYTQCNVSSNGIESNSCLTITPSGNGALSSPRALAFDESYAYFANDTNNSYTQCSLGSNGIESTTCNTIIPTTGIFTNPRALALNNNYAYFTNFGNNSYTQCNTDSNGIESQTCAVVTPTGNGALSQPGGIGFYSGHAYFSNYYTNSYTQCSLSGGVINPASCNTVIPGDSGIMSGPYGIAFYTIRQ